VPGLTVKPREKEMGSRASWAHLPFLSGMSGYPRNLWILLGTENPSSRIQNNSQLGAGLGIYFHTPWCEAGGHSYPAETLL
jgi:hypothetical protein